MPFWNDASVEPKRDFRWLLYMPTLTGDANSPAIETYTIQDVQKPSYTIAEKTVPFMIHTFKYPGRITWNPVTVNLLDPVNPDNAGTLTKVLMASGYKTPDNQNNAEFSFSKASSVNALNNPRIVQIDSGDPLTGRNPREIEEWTLINAWVKDVKFGNLKYGGEDLVKIALTLTYDYALYRGDYNPVSGEMKEVLK